MFFISYFEMYKLKEANERKTKMLLLVVYIGRQ